MKRTRQVLAITLLTAALCADRAIAASPVLRPQVASVAGKLVSRLSVTFRRVVPTVRVYQASQDVVVLAPAPQPPIANETCSSERLSPLLLRLPPPASI